MGKVCGLAIRNPVFRNLLCIFLVSWCVATAGEVRPALGANELTLNSPELPPYMSSDNQGYLQLLLPEVFRRIDLSVDVYFLPAAARAVDLASRGIDDGLAERSAGLDKAYPSLLPVQERVNVYDFVVFSSDAEVQASDWSEMSGYTKAHIIGWKILEENLRGQDDVIAVREPSQLFELLREKRVDMVLYERWQGVFLAKSMGIEVFVSEPPLMSVDQFIFLHEKHKDLIEPLAEVLREMKRDGSFQQIVDETLTIDSR